MAALPSPAPQLTCDDRLWIRPLFPRRDQVASFATAAEGLLSGEQCKSVERTVLRQPGAT